MANASELNRATCHCGTVVMVLAHKPTEVFECNCSICRRLGVLWAYYPCDHVLFEKGSGKTKVYLWNHKIIEFHSCATCGCTTHWIAVDKNFRERMGINARLIDGLDRNNTALGHVDHGEIGSFWTTAPD
ncbi:MAG: GFA family protein [Pseudomonadota bacterium]